jgi:hypothetical protein
MCERTFVRVSLLSFVANRFHVISLLIAHFDMSQLRLTYLHGIVIIHCRVARWYSFPILIYFGRPSNGNFWYILWPFGTYIL